MDNICEAPPWIRKEKERKKRQNNTIIWGIEYSGGILLSSLRFYVLFRNLQEYIIYVFRKKQNHVYVKYKNKLKKIFSKSQLDVLGNKIFPH